MSKQPSDWQKRITGDWHGRPSVFDAAGNHCGWIKVSRASVFEDGKTMYFMDTSFADVTGPLRNRFEFTEFAFGLNDDELNRVYLGPDFIGAGHPYGAFVDSHYYSPAWTADLRTVVHILEDGRTQVYSSQLFDGPTQIAVFNGLYTLSDSYDSDDSERERVDSFCATEKSAGTKPHFLPPKTRGRWSGDFAVYNADQTLAGKNHVTIEHEPINLVRSSQRITFSGVYDRSVGLVRHRVGNRHSYEGPDVFGNGLAYGRALYVSQHEFGSARKLSGREFVIDDDYTLSCYWHLYEGDIRVATTYGLLKWEPSE